jgi:hypothetical protein
MQRSPIRIRLRPQPKAIFVWVASWNGTATWTGLWGAPEVQKQTFPKNNEIYSFTFSRNFRGSVCVLRGMEVELWSGTVCGNTVWGVRLECYGVVVGWYVGRAGCMCLGPSGCRIGFFYSFFSLKTEIIFVRVSRNIHKSLFQFSSWSSDIIGASLMLTISVR